MGSLKQRRANQGLCSVWGEKEKVPEGVCVCVNTFIPGHSLGTTRRGIGPAYTAKVRVHDATHHWDSSLTDLPSPLQAARDGFRVCDLYGDWEVFEER